MDRLGDAFLADAGLAEDEDGHRRVGDPLDERVDAAHRRIEDDRLAGRRRCGRPARRALAGAQAGAQVADQRLDGGAVVGAQGAGDAGLGGGRAGEVERALDRGVAFGAAELGEDEEVVVAGVLGEQVHRAERARDRIDHGVVGAADEADGERAVIADRAIDLGGEAGFAGGVVGDRARAAQAAGDADDREDRADLDLVAALRRGGVPRSCRR